MGMSHYNMVNEMLNEKSRLKTIQYDLNILKFMHKYMYIYA